MEIKLKWNKNIIFVFAVCIISFGFLIHLLFFQFQRQLGEQFDQLIEQNLTDYAISQNREVKFVMKDLFGTLNAIAIMMNTSDQDPSGEWMTNYLKSVSTSQEKYVVTYIPIEQLQQALTEEGIDSKDKVIFDQLVQGENVVSEVRRSKRMGNRYFFSIAVPVCKNGEAVGVLRSLLEAEVLVQTLQTGSFSDSVDSYIVKSNGDFVRVHKGKDEFTENLYYFLDHSIKDDAVLQEVKDAIENHANITLKMNADDGFYYYISITDLEVNDWHIVNFTRADYVTSYSETIFRYTMQMSLVLIFLTASGGWLLFWYFIKQKKKLEWQHTRYYMLSKFSDTVLFTYSYETDVLEFTPNAKALLSIEKLRFPDFMKKKKIPFLYAEDYPILLDAIENKSKVDQLQKNEVRLLGGSQTYFWSSLQYQISYNKEGNPSLFVGKLMDIHLQKEREKGLILKSETDALTGVYNKKTTEEKIQKYLKTASKKVYFFMIDLDDFKLVNDKMGHAVGDQMLAEVGKKLKTVFGLSAIAGRIGGDEFVVALELDEDKEAQEKALEMVQILSKIGLNYNGKLKVSCSIGISVSPEDGKDYDSLYSRADQAMYYAKSKGKNSFFLWKESQKIENTLE